MHRYDIARWLFLRLLAVSYLSAFVSLAVQIDGLLGRRGILPAYELLAVVAQRVGAVRWLHFPTLLWFDSSDTALHVLAWGGAVLSVLLLFDVAPRIVLGLLWVAYLSLVAVGQDFLSFQWDALLLETGFLAIFLAPWRIRPHWPPVAPDAPDAPPVASRAARLAAGAPLFLLWGLLFKLMFSSGGVKLRSGDPTWRSLTALDYHFETQPLPTPVSWYAHQLPAVAHRIACFSMFVIELAAPFLVFAPARWRRLAFPPLVALQLVIAITGNYAFFNLLSIALGVLLLDDAAWPGWLRRVVAPRGLVAGSSVPDGLAVATDSTPASAPAARRIPAPGPWRVRTTLAAAGLMALLSLAQLLDTFGWRRAWGPLEGLVRASSLLRITSRYGLFAVMTTTRDEILVEGSDDGSVWKTYVFRWKPAAVERLPRFVAPHQPRLDWQMWFASLTSFESEPWFSRFCESLLLGSPDVARLLAENPFPEHPPRYLRAEVERYRFTNRAERRATGAWWKREPPRPYSPVLSLREAR